MMEVEALLHENEEKDLLRFVTAGSVDDGKSTLIGQLLYAANAIYEDQLAAVEEASGKTGSAHDGLDLSLVTDGLRAEREQGITIDVAYRYFSTPRRKFIIADTPGHEQYTRNMATGASTADLMVILLDAASGVQPQSRRHAFIAALLGIPHVVVVVNKMDLVDYDERVYTRIRREFSEFAAKLNVADLTFIPVSALHGDNVVEAGANTPWYHGTTLLNHLETVHIASDVNLIDLRIPVQLVSRLGPDERAYLGTVASGVVRVGDHLTILPAGNSSVVRALRDPSGEVEEASAGQAVSVLLTDQVDISRGDVLVHQHNRPKVCNRIEAMMVWMSESPMRPGRPYRIKHCTRTAGASVESLRYRIDINTLHRQEASELALNEIGRVSIRITHPLMTDAYRRNRRTGAFILIDRATNSTVGAGMIIERGATDDGEREKRERSPATEKLLVQQASLVSAAERRARFGHGAATVWLTGAPGAGKSTIANALERRLHDQGIACLVLDGENMRLGLSADLTFSPEDRDENIRRAAAVARLANDAGLVVISAFVSPYAAARRDAREAVGQHPFVEVYLTAPAAVLKERQPNEMYAAAERGEIEHFTGVTDPYEPPANAELTLATDEQDVDSCVSAVVEQLAERGVW
jgi:bifunctional enzyme CysN/CysC